MTTTLPTTQTPAAAVAPIAGIHHVTAITADAQATIEFYTRTLGLRLVKVTINYDDPGTYHLYYGDGLGRPGTIMTHFAWPGAHRGTAGAGLVTETAFTIPAGAADYWVNRLTTAGVTGVERTTRFGQPVVTLHDADGMPLALVEVAEPLTDEHFWAHGQVPAEVAIRGFHSVTLAETSELHPARVLVKRFGYTEVAREGARVRYEAAGDAIARVVDVVLVNTTARPRMGAGQVHHVAFRTPTDDQQAEWLRLLRQDGYNVSPVMDRDYFHSIYFREPGGVLFEIATDAPGMTVNEAPEELGSHILLPAWLEPQRAQVEAVLPKITLATRVDSVAGPAKKA